MKCHTEFAVCECVASVLRHVLMSAVLASSVTAACPFANCVPSLLAVVDARVSVPLPSLAVLYPRLKHAHAVFHAVTLADQANITVFEFGDSQAGE
jgi:hypothetical protein